MKPKLQQIWFKRQWHSSKTSKNFRHHWRVSEFQRFFISQIILNWTLLLSNQWNTISIYLRFGTNIYIYLTANDDSTSLPALIISLGLKLLPSHCAMKQGSGFVERLIGMLIVNKLQPLSVLPVFKPNLKTYTSWLEWWCYFHKVYTSDDKRVWKCEKQRWWKMVNFYWSEK